MNIESLAEKYALDSIERSLLAYLLKHQKQLKKMGVRQVASENFTSTTTVYKLARKLGYDGYADMVHSLFRLLNEKRHVANNDQKEEIEKAVHLHQQSFANMLTSYKDKQLMFVGFGLSQHIANYMSESFILRGYRSLANVHLQLISEQHKDNVLLIIVSESGSTPRQLEIAKIAKNNGLPIITFVGCPDSPLGKHSTLDIPIGNHSPITKDVHSANLFFPSVLYVFEHLLASLDLS